MSVSGKTQVGKFYERIGDDYLTVNVTNDKTVLEIEQWDAIGRRMNSVNFFTASAPKLVNLIQKAAGIEAEKVEYEYNIERTSLDHGTSHLQRERWLPLKEAKEDLAGYNEAEEIHEAEHGFRYASYRMVKRRKAGGIEDA